MLTPTWPGCFSMATAEIASLDRDGVTALAWASLAEGYFAGRDTPSLQRGPDEQRR